MSDFEKITPVNFFVWVSSYVVIFDNLFRSPVVTDEGCTHKAYFQANSRWFLHVRLAFLLSVNRLLSGRHVRPAVEV